VRHSGEHLRVQLQGPAVPAAVGAGPVRNEQLQHRHVPAIKTNEVMRNDDDDDDDDSYG